MAIVLVYLVALALTRPPFVGDTPYYVESLVARFQGQYLEYWEPGHVLWRPLGWLILRIVRALHIGGAAAPVEAMEFRLAAFHVFIGLSEIMGAVALIAFIVWLRRLEAGRLSAMATAVLFALSNAFLVYAQTGSAYVPALSMLMLGTCVLACHDEEHSAVAMVLLASAAFALSVLFWLPMVLAVPGAACSTAVLRGASARRRWIVVATWCGSGGMTIVAYLSVLQLIGVHDLAGAREWVATASHGIDSGGIGRAIFGLSQSVLRMDRLGLIAKRYLLGDPYNPATWKDVFSAGLTRVACFYSVLGGSLILLCRHSPGRRVLGLCATIFIPVFGFAVYWQGGDPERYLALFPALFLMLRAALTRTPKLAQRLCTTGLVGALIAVNFPSLWRPRTNHACAVIAQRLDAVTPRDDGRALVVTPHALDEAVAAVGNCFDNPVIARGNLDVDGLVMPHTAEAPQWRQRFAANALKAWGRQQKVWVSTRGFALKPLPEWRWVEGDDPRVRWSEFPAFFSQMDFGSPVGGLDGFVELQPTQRTLAALRASDSAGPS